MPIFLLAAGALLGAAAGGTLGWVGAGVTGAAVGVGVGAIAGLGIGATAYALSRPVYWYPIPLQHPYYGNWGYYAPGQYAGPRLYYMP